MNLRKGSIIAAFVALSLLFAANSFAMMGGGGGHGTYSNRNHSGGYYQNYNNNRSDKYETGVGRYDQGDATRVKGSVRFEQNTGYQGDYHHGQSDDHMGPNNPHYNSRNGVDPHLNQPGYGFDHHNF